MAKITNEIIAELLKTKSDGSLYHREAKDLEFKESFSLSGIGDYLKDFAAFANNYGGYLIFGITNSPRKLKGLSIKGKEKFKSLDEERVSGFINEYFSPYYDWEFGTFNKDGETFGIIYIYQSIQKPVICKKDYSDILKNGSIYYRYAGRTQVIQYSELAFIIEERIKTNNKLWIDKVTKIADAGPANVGILDTHKGIIENGSGSLLIDETLIKKIKFIKEGEFSEKKGARTLKLIGDVAPIDTVEVERVIKKRITDEYPISYRKLEREIKTRYPDVKLNKIQKIIKENRIKYDKAYSDFNFRTKEQEEKFLNTGKLPNGITSLYNQSAIELISKIIKNENK